MFGNLQNLAGDVGALCAALATGAAWIVVVVSPNVSYDRLDASRADGHVRELIVASSAWMSAILLAACALGVLAGHFGSAITAGLAAFGFFTNRWTLAPKKKGEAPPGVRTRHKTKRVVAVSLSLMFMIASMASAVLGLFGV